MCKRYLGKSYNKPPVASLPEFRVQETPAFSKVGVDFAGPLYAKDGGTMEKVYSISRYSRVVFREGYIWIWLEVLA